MKALLLISLCLVGLATACGAAEDPPTQSRSDTLQSVRGVDSRAQSGGTTAAGSASALAGTANDKVVITTALSLQVPAIRNAYAEIAARVRSLGGYVAELRITDRDKDPANLRLRVPATRHDDLLLGLRSLQGAKVRGEDSNAREVTAEYTDLESRLRNLRRSEAQYQSLLDRAGTIAEVVQVSAKLDEVRGQIEAAQGRLNLLNDATDYATVNVTLTPALAATSGVARPGEVFQDTLSLSMVFALLLLNAIVAALVFAAWLVPAGFAGILGWKLCGRPLKAIGGRILSL